MDETIRSIFQHIGKITEHEQPVWKVGRPTRVKNEIVQLKGSVGYSDWEEFPLGRDSIAAL